jgi:ATP-dependent helicase/nuclease subunit A
LLHAALAPLDWIGPALACQSDLQALLGEAAEPVAAPEAPARFAVATYDAPTLDAIAASELPACAYDQAVDLRVLAAVGHAGLSAPARAVVARAAWRYPHAALTRLSARASVTDIRRQRDHHYEVDFVPDPAAAAVLVSEGLPAVFRRRPEFLGDAPAAPTGADVGTWTHAFLQRLDLAGPLDAAGLEVQLGNLVGRGFFLEHQAAGIHLAQVARFFASDLGRLILTRRDEVRREWPFTLAVPLAEVRADLSPGPADAAETVLVRGMIDLLVPTPGGWRVVDFKTDQVTAEQVPARAAGYATQLHYYRRAVESILKAPVAELGFYFLAPSVAYALP